MVFVGLILVAAGVFALLINLGILSGSLWGYVWPVALIILGLSFLWGRRSRRMRVWRRHWGPPDEEQK